MRLRVAVREVGIGGEREIVAAVLLLAAADDHGAERLSRRQHLAGVCHHDGAVALPRRHERGSEAEADLSISGLLGCLGFEGGDFRGCNGSKPWPPRASAAGAGHGQNAHA